MYIFVQIVLKMYENIIHNILPMDDFQNRIIRPDYQIYNSGLAPTFDPDYPSEQTCRDEKRVSASKDRRIKFDAD